MYMAAKKKGTLVDVSVIGSKGGKARAANLSKKQRSESARNAVKARWEQYRAKKDAKAKGAEK